MTAAKDHGCFLRIASIVTWQNADGNTADGIVGRVYDIVGPAFGSTYMKIVHIIETFVYVPAHHVIAPAVQVKMEIGGVTYEYMSPLPTTWDIV